MVFWWFQGFFGSVRPKRPKNSDFLIQIQSALQKPIWPKTIRFCRFFGPWTLDLGAQNQPPNGSKIVAIFKKFYYTLCPTTSRIHDNAKTPFEWAESITNFNGKKNGHKKIPLELLSVREMECVWVILAYKWLYLKKVKMLPIWTLTMYIQGKKLNNVKYENVLRLLKLINVLW